ncbi:MAG: transposase [Lachnospiraceae bacterium]
MDNLTAGEKKCLQLIQQIQEMEQEGVGIAEISRRTGKDIGTVKKYKQGDPLVLCRHGRKGKSILDPYRDIILSKLKAKTHQADIIRYITENGYTGTKTNAQIYIRKLCEEYDISASKYRSGGNSRGTEKTGNSKSMEADYITRAGIFNQIWMEIKLTDEHKNYLWRKYSILYEISTCINEFRQVFVRKSMPLLYLFIEKYQVSSIKELASFAKGLQRDIGAVENAVSSDKSNGFVEGNNSRLKMVKRTMYGRCGKHLLAAKLLYQKRDHTQI